MAQTPLPAPTQLGRRSLLVGGAGSALGGLIFGAADGAVASVAEPAAGYPQLYRYYKALIGGYADRETFSGVSGVYYADTGTDMIPLFGFLGARLARARAEPDRIAVRGKVSLLFVDLANGRPLDHWRNPWTGETVAVRHLFNKGGGGASLPTVEADHFVSDALANHGYRGEAHTPALGANEPAAKGPILFDLPWRRVGSQYLLARHFNFRSPNPVTPALWPTASTGPILDQQEWLQFYTPAEALNQPNIQTLPVLTALTQRSPWLPFMRMGRSGVAGRMMSVAHSYKVTGTIEDVPPVLREYLERHQPDQLVPYDRWDGHGVEDFWQAYAADVPPEVG